jgi:hypothetical protein
MDANGPFCGGSEESSPLGADLAFVAARVCGDDLLSTMRV